MTDRPVRLSERLYLRLAVADVAMLRFLLEAHDNLGFVTVVDRFTAVARLNYAPGNERAVRQFLADARSQITFDEIRNR